MSGYSPEEYEQLKEFYKKDWQERRAFLEELRRRKLRQQAEWHLRQMEDSLRALGIAPDMPSPSRSSESVPPSDISDEGKTLL